MKIYNNEFSSDKSTSRQIASVKFYKILKFPGNISDYYKINFCNGKSSNHFYMVPTFDCLAEKASYLHDSSENSTVLEHKIWRHISVSMVQRKHHLKWLEKV